MDRSSPAFFCTAYIFVDGSEHSLHNLYGLAYRPGGLPVFVGGAMERGDTADTLLDLPPTLRQMRWALAFAAIALAGFAAVVPIADRPLAQLNAFFPSLDSIVFVSELITAVLLYAQFSISRSRALLALATGYLFTALSGRSRQPDCWERTSRPDRGYSSFGTSAFQPGCSPTRC